MQYSLIKKLVAFLLLCSICCNEQGHKQKILTKTSIENKFHDTNEVAKLLKAYPDFIAGINSNKIIFKDRSFLTFKDDIKNKSWDQLINTPSIEDQFIFPYIKGKPEKAPTKNEDPGRVRNEMFFKKMYGATKAEVEKNLVEIDWLPHTLHEKIKVTHINDIDKKLTAISNELDKSPRFSKYLTNIGGTFNWRYIKGTKRLSEHSFGIAIDINTAFSNYWIWDCGCTNELTSINYHNRIPFNIVAIFEKYGFIWGGKWYHYDTMHFEYRPELCSPFS